MALALVSVTAAQWPQAKYFKQATASLLAVRGTLSTLGTGYASAPWSRLTSLVLQEPTTIKLASRSVLLAKAAYQVRPPSFLITSDGPFTN